MERSTIFNGKIHYKSPFSIATLNYKSVVQYLQTQRYFNGSLGNLMNLMVMFGNGSLPDDPWSTTRVSIAKSSHMDLENARG
jgi:hypothetical protein